MITIPTANNNQKSAFSASSPASDVITFHVYWFLLLLTINWIYSTVNCLFYIFWSFFSYFLAFLLTNFTNQSEDIYLYVIPSLSFVFLFCLRYMLPYDIHCRLFMWSKIQLLFLFSFLSRLHRSPTPMVLCILLIYLYSFLSPFLPCFNLDH